MVLQKAIPLLLNFLRKDKKKKGVYLQMYETFWDRERKQARTRCIRSFGYVDELRSESIPDPVSYYRELVSEEEKKRLAELNDSTRPRVFDEITEKNASLNPSLMNSM